MKKILVLMALIILVLAMSVSAAKPPKNMCTTIQSGELVDKTGTTITTGFDMWGYNYQAKLFNGDYCDAYRNAAWCQEYKDDSLSMKWNDAWLSNKDCDNDGKLDKHYGFDSYIGSGAWLTNHMSGDYTEWSVLGDWDFDFYYNGNLYPHTVSINTETDGAFTATGLGLNDNNPWTATGTVNGEDFTMHIDYDNTVYWVDIVGLITEDGSIEGTWSNNGQYGIFSTSKGIAISTNCNWNYFVKIVAVPADAVASDGIWYSAKSIEIGPVIWGSFAVIQEVENDVCAGMHGLQYSSAVSNGLGMY